MAVGTTPEKVGASLDAPVHGRPREASWLARLRFWLSDRRVRFDPSKYGWPREPDTVSWVLPTSMALITLERGKKRGWIRGTELQNPLRLGAEIFLDRACLEVGWNAGSAIVYGVPSRPHIDATALALAALRFHYCRPIVRNSLTWRLESIEYTSAYSLAWTILAAAAYKDVRADVLPAIDIARNRLAALFEDPRAIEDTSTIALAALALGPEGANNPFEVKL